MTTSKHLKQQRDNLTSLQEDFPVRISQLQDNKKESEKELGQDYFTSAYGYLGKFDQSSPSLKMLEIYSPLKKGKYSKKSSFKLPKQGMMLNGQLFQQEMWVAATFESVSGSYATLATPNCMDALPQRGYDSMLKQTQVHRKGRTKLSNLREQVDPKARQLFEELQQMKLPTPTSQEAGKGDFLKTLVTKDGKPAKLGQRAYNPKTGKHVQITLDRAVKMNLPTPTSRDWKDSGENMNYKKAAEKKRLVGVLNHTHSDLTGEDTTLNPAFVEEMMGFPIGWTQIGETEKKE